MKRRVGTRSPRASISPKFSHGQRAILFLMSSTNRQFLFVISFISEVLNIERVIQPTGRAAFLSLSASSPRVPAFRRYRVPSTVALRYDRKKTGSRIGFSRRGAPRRRPQRYSMFCRIDRKSIREIGRVAAGTIRGDINFARRDMYPRASSLCVRRILSRTGRYGARYGARYTFVYAYITATRTAAKGQKALLECGFRSILDVGQAGYPRLIRGVREGRERRPSRRDTNWEISQEWGRDERERRKKDEEKREGRRQ